RFAVLRMHRKLDHLAVVLHFELRHVMLAWENPSSSKLVQPRIGVAPGNVNALPRLPFLVLPLHRYAMRRVLTANAQDRRHSVRSDLFQSDQADPRDGESIVQLRKKTRGQLRLHHFRSDPIIHQNSPPDQALDSGNSHWQGILISHSPGTGSNP